MLELYIDRVVPANSVANWNEGAPVPKAPLLSPGYAIGGCFSVARFCSSTYTYRGFAKRQSCNFGLVSSFYLCFSCTHENWQAVGRVADCENCVWASHILKCSSSTRVKDMMSKACSTIL